MGDVRYVVQPLFEAFVGSAINCSRVIWLIIDNKVEWQELSYVVKSDQRLSLPSNNTSSFLTTLFPLYPALLAFCGFPKTSTRPTKALCFPVSVGHEDTLFPSAPLTATHATEKAPTGSQGLT